jgi:phage N-6-adenine-methyltransferase
MDDILYSRNSDEWSTPDDIFKKLDAEFKFNLDPCATKENAKCQRFFTKKDDGLKMSWGGAESVLQSSVFRNQRLGGEGLQRISER